MQPLTIKIMLAYTMLYTARHYSLKALNMLTILILHQTTTPILQVGKPGS